MRKIKSVFHWVVFATVAAVALGASATRRGTSVLHYTTSTALVPTEVGSNVTASLRLDLKEQGNAAGQKFDLKAEGLPPGTVHSLLAVKGENLDVSEVGTATSDSRGQLTLSYMQQGQGNGSGKKALPDGLNPVTDLRGFGLQVGTQVLAFAWVNASSKYQYLVDRNLTQQDIHATPAGSIHLKASASSVNFRLWADGLSVSNTYYLKLNSNVVQAVTADGTGALTLKAWPTNAPAVLDLRSLALLDGGSNVVLSTTLPK